MSERFYPLTEEEKLRRRILSRQPARAPYSPPIDVLVPKPTQTPAPDKLPGCTFTKPCQLPDGITRYTDPTGYVPLELIKDYGYFSLLGGREVDSQGTTALRKITCNALPVGLGQLALRTAVVESAATAVGTVAGGLLTGLVALVWPSELGSSINFIRPCPSVNASSSNKLVEKGDVFITQNHISLSISHIYRFRYCFDAATSLSNLRHFTKSATSF